MAALMSAALAKLINIFFMFKILSMLIVEWQAAHVVRLAQPKIDCIKEAYVFTPDFNMTATLRLCNVSVRSPE